MLMIKSRCNLLLLCCALLILATGCWGSRETDQLAYVLAMGIDKGKESQLQVTFQVAALEGGGEEGGGPKGSETFTVEAASVFGALQLANAFVSRDVTLMHNRAIFVSAEVAREGLSQHINTFIRSREIRRNTLLLITPGQAAEVIKNNEPILESNPSRQFELLIGAEEYTAFLPVSTIHGINIALKSPGEEAVAALIGVNEQKGGEEKDYSLVERIEKEVAYLPGEIPRQGGNKIDVIGLAVFDGDKLAGYLNGAETRYYQMAAGQFNSAIFTFPDPQEPGEHGLEIKIKKGRRPQIKVLTKGDEALIEVDIILEGEIIGISSGINYENGEKELELERYLEKLISSEIHQVIKKTQLEYKSDIFGFGDYTRKNFLTWEKWQEYGWLEKYPEAGVKVTTRLAIRRTGLMSKTVQRPVEN